VLYGRECPRDIRPKDIGTEIHLDGQTWELAANRDPCRLGCASAFCVDPCFSFLREDSFMSQLRKVVLAAVAFMAAGFGSVAMAGCGGDAAASSCGGRGGLMSRLHARKDTCSGAAAKNCGGGLLSKLQSKRASKCSGAAASCSTPAPAPACAPAPAGDCGGVVTTTTVTSDCGCAGSATVNEGVVYESASAAPCVNCATTVNSGEVTTSSSVPPAPAAAAPAAAPAAPAAVPAAAPAAPAVPEAPAAPAAGEAPKA
jgi:hypothetical protein